MHLHFFKFKKLNFDYSILGRLIIFLRYDLYHGIRNLFIFFNIIWKYRPWNFDYNTGSILKKCIYLNYINIEKNGYEVDDTRIPKIRQMKTVVKLLDNLIKDRYIKLAELKYGELCLKDIKYQKIDTTSDDYKDMIDFNPEDRPNPEYHEIDDDESDEERIHNRKIFKYAQEIETRQWNKIWDIIKGDIECSNGTNAQSWWD